MAWNYRKRVKIAPGVHINFSKNGISTSIGPKGAKVSFGKNGTYLNTGIPGTGLYSRKKISGRKDISSYGTKTNSNNNGCYGCLIIIGIILFFLGGSFINPQDSTHVLIGMSSVGIGIFICYKLIHSKKDNTSNNPQIETKEEDCYNNSTQESLPTETSLDKQAKFTSIFDFDPFLEEAVRAILLSGVASTSMIQRRFAIGYNRAGRIMDELERIGVVGPSCGSSPRELLVHNIDEWENLKSRYIQEHAKQKADDESTTSNASSSHSLTEEQFNLIKTVSDNLCAFMTKLVRKRNVRTKLGEMLQIDNSDGTPWEISQKVKLAIITDIYRCYKGLGHDFFIDNDYENIGIYLFLGKYLKPDNDITFNAVPMLRNTLKYPFADLLKTSELLDQNAKISPNEFFLQKALGECDRELQVQYMSLLYRFASAVAKADGQVNETEEKWLADLMKSKELNIGEGSNIKISDSQEQIPIESPYEMLNDLIGLTSVKEEITKLANFIKIQQIRDSKGLKTPEISYHCVFTGNPGTGKTTVARIMASIYKELGILKKGHLVETDRSGLVAEYVGQTAVKTNKIIDSALDGVLFIDEAYSLVQGVKGDYGQEAISTLLKRMEDDRNRLIVILAGYSSEMKEFIDSNPGLQSRFNRYIHFSDYTADELKQIFMLNTKKNQYTIDEDALAVLDEIMISAIEHKDKNFGNARFVRNIFEKSIQNQAMRLSSQSNITEDVLSILKAEDLPTC